jgi:hypothetical protein
MRWGDPGFSDLLLGGYLALLTTLWGLLWVGASRWHRAFALPPADDRGLPRLAICIPARDEAHQVGACVRAALAQDHPDFEVIVVDDCSGDGTAEVARRAGAGDPRLRVVQGAPPATGWAGKPWACARAAAEAHAQQLLFIDADVELAPQAARRAAAALRAGKVGLLSLFGTWKLESFWERVAIPVVGWFIRGATDVRAVNAPGRPEAFANGQFILVDREAYDAVGGHGAVRAEILDDVRLARAFKQRGVALALYAAPDLFRVRLYRSLGEITSGYAKNLYEGMDRRPHVALGALLFLLVGMALPWGLLAASLLVPGALLPAGGARWLWTAWIAAACALPLAVRARTEVADGRSGWLAVTHLLGNAILAWILIGTVLRVRAAWKGRPFHDGRALHE